MEMADALKSLDDQITIRIPTDIRNRIDGMSDPLTYGKAADIARVLLEFGLRAAERHGYHNILGAVKRGVPIELTEPTLQTIIAPLKPRISDEPVSLANRDTGHARAKKAVAG